MKHIIFLCLLMFMCLLPDMVVYADTAYHSFETLELTEGYLLSDYTDDDYSTFYKHVNKRKFAGWRVYTVHDDIKVSYITETLFSYYNDGYTPIEYSFELKSSSTTKISLSATGSIGLNNTKSTKGFKNNLEGELKLSSEYTQTIEEDMSYTIDFEVDPGTQVDLYIYGEGKITNGVAARYLFWIRMNRGGYEVFTITTQYQRLEKKRI